MRNEGIYDLVSQGLDVLISQDNYLLENDLSERSITHRLAVHLQEFFVGYDIDCEYNGALESEKERKKIWTTRQILERLNLLKDSDGEVEEVSRLVYPDIIVHKRGSHEDNLCIIEVKKSSSKVPSVYDEIKLESYTSAKFGNVLNYQLGIFIELSIGSNKEVPYVLRIYKDGQEIHLKSICDD